jgi:DNA-binding IclR family transcriptional regulator
MEEHDETPSLAALSTSADIQAVARAAQILGLFSNSSAELTVSGTATRLGLNRTTVHRYCTSMVAAGLLSRADEHSGTYVPGPLAVQLGAFTLGRRTVLELADKHLRELSDALRMTAVLSQWGSLGPVVAKVHENRTGAVLITVPVGTQLSLDTAQSVLFLAYAPDQLSMQRLRAALPASSQQDVGSRIERARRVGVAGNSFADGITSIAAPVFGPAGICATLALVHTSAMLSLDTDSPEARRLISAANDLSLEMGGAPLMVEMHPTAAGSDRAEEPA